MAETWIDTHIHVSDRDEDGEPRDRLSEDLRNVLDGADADLQLVIQPDAVWCDLVRDEPDGAPRANAFIGGLVERAPDRLHGSCLVNPNFLDASLRAMEACFEKWGFVQLGEMLQYMFDFKMDSAATERLVRKAVEYGVPTQVHVSTSNTRTHASSFGRDQLLDLFALAERVPEAEFILAHAVGGVKDGRPVIDEYVDLVEQRFGSWPRRFWVEIAQFHTPALAAALERIPSDRLIAGTDWTTRVGPPFLPYGAVFGAKTASENPFPPKIGSLIGFLKAAGADDDTVERIAHANAAALLGIGGVKGA